MLSGMPDDDAPPPRQFKLKPKAFERVNAPPGTDAKSDDHDVFAIRRQLREREQAAGLDEIAPPAPKKSRRMRDFCVCLVLGWGGLIGIGAIAVGRVGVYAGAALGIPFTAALWWIIFHILDDY
jgi:hypothetical protein